jgi:hypothetical protein
LALDITQKAQATKGRMDKWDYIKLKIFVYEKYDTVL